MSSAVSGIFPAPAIGADRFVPNREIERARARPDESTLECFGRHSAGERRSIRSAGPLDQPLEMLSSYAYLDGKVVSSNYYPDAIGAPLANVPRNTFNFWSTYRLPWRVETAWGELRLKPHVKRDQAARSDNRALKRSAGLLGIQCHGEAPAYGTPGPASECQ